MGISSDAYEEPGKDWLAILQNDESPPSEMMLF